MTEQPEMTICEVSLRSYISDTGKRNWSWSVSDNSDPAELAALLMRAFMFLSTGKATERAGDE